MARTVITQITDDIDGSKDAEEVRFSFKGVDYSIDLNKKNQSALEKALRPYIEAGTKVSTKGSSRRGESRRRATSARGESRDLRAIRAWAREQGLEVSERGRIPAGIIEKYDNR